MSSAQTTTNSKHTPSNLKSNTASTRNNRQANNNTKSNKIDSCSSSSRNWISVNQHSKPKKLFQTKLMAGGSDPNRDVEKRNVNSNSPTRRSARTVATAPAAAGASSIKSPPKAIGSRAGREPMETELGRPLTRLDEYFAQESKPVETLLSKARQGKPSIFSSPSRHHTKSRKPKVEPDSDHLLSDETNVDKLDSTAVAKDRTAQAHPPQHLAVPSPLSSTSSTTQTKKTTSSSSSPKPTAGTTSHAPPTATNLPPTHGRVTRSSSVVASASAQSQDADDDREKETLSEAGVESASTVQSKRKRGKESKPQPISPLRLIDRKQKKAPKIEVIEISSTSSGSFQQPLSQQSFSVPSTFSSEIIPNKNDEEITLEEMVDEEEENQNIKKFRKTPPLTPIMYSISSSLGADDEDEVEDAYDESQGHVVNWLDSIEKAGAVKVTPSVLEGQVRTRRTASNELMPPPPPSLTKQQTTTSTAAAPDSSIVAVAGSTTLPSSSVAANSRPQKQAIQRQPSEQSTTSERDPYNYTPLPVQPSLTSTYDDSSSSVVSTSQPGSRAQSFQGGNGDRSFSVAGSSRQDSFASFTSSRQSPSPGGGFESNDGHGRDRHRRAPSPPMLQSFVSISSSLEEDILADGQK